jgi:hypothetical protein
VHQDPRKPFTLMIFDEGRVTGLGITDFAIANSLFVRVAAVAAAFAQDAASAGHSSTGTERSARHRGHSTAIATGDQAGDRKRALGIAGHVQKIYARYRDHNDPALQAEIQQYINSLTPNARKRAAPMD